MLKEVSEPRLRIHGTAGPLVAVLHGGPGAPGYMAPVARRLATGFRVLEPLQRGAGEVRLTVARHVQDLHDLLTSPQGAPRVPLVGSSWGAMLALAYGATHPERRDPLVLVGCGTFDLDARARMRVLLQERTTDALRKRLEDLEREIPDADERLRRTGDLITPLYEVDPVDQGMEGEPCDARAHAETWEDMLRVQAAGTYPAAFSAIQAPVIMLHGAFDPHPGGMIRDTLRCHIPHLEYVEWERCGHYPWRERAVSEEFYRVLHAWLTRHTAPEPGPKA